MSFISIALQSQAPLAPPIGLFHKRTHWPGLALFDTPIRVEYGTLNTKYWVGSATVHHSIVNYSNLLLSPDAHPPQVWLVWHDTRGSSRLPPQSPAQPPTGFV
jgi:hypothetical protein